MTDTLYIVLPHGWAWPAIALFGALVGFPAAALLGSWRPQWSVRRRRLTAALIPAGLILGGALLGIALVLAKASPGDWSDLVVAAVLQLGTLAALVAGAAAFGAALLAERVGAP